MEELSFSDEALAFLRKAVYDENATRGLELLSMSFVWSDERMSRLRLFCKNGEERALREFRTSLILGRPIEEYRHLWDQVIAECPDWPGIRPERYSPDLFPEWQREKHRALADFLREIRDSKTTEQQATE